MRSISYRFYTNNIQQYDFSIEFKLHKVIYWNESLNRICLDPWELLKANILSGKISESCQWRNLYFAAEQTVHDHMNQRRSTKFMNAYSGNISRAFIFTLRYVW